MRKIVYYVATSLDGFIAGPNEDISGFLPEGKGIDQYFKDLKSFDTVIMGRKTYEFGYKWGIKPGEPAYPHMKHYIFSNSLSLPPVSEQVNVCQMDLPIIDELKNESDSDIYLAGGGEFAGWLFEHQKIDILKIKLNPLILGDGIRLFGSCHKQIFLEILDTQKYDDGLHILTYKISYQ